jgi:hypothetical protein
MPKTYALANIVADYIFGNTMPPSRTALHFALFTAAPNKNGGGTEVSASGGTGYTRVSVTQNASNWPTASNGAKSNGNSITFPTATASWGTVTHLGIYDSGTLGSGTLLAYINITSRTIDPGDTVSIASGDFDVTED